VPTKVVEESFFVGWALPTTASIAVVKSSINSLLTDGSYNRVRSKTVEFYILNSRGLSWKLGSPEGYPTVDKYIFSRKQLLLTTPVTIFWKN